MEKLLQMAKRAGDKAEIYWEENTRTSVSFQNAKLHDIDSAIHSGLALRIIKNGKLGFAYTKNLINRDELLQNALTSLEGKVEANYDFPLTPDFPLVHTYDPSLEDLSTSRMVEEGTRVCDLLKSQTNGEIFLNSSSHITKIRILNSKGTDVSSQSGEYSILGGIVYPGSASAIMRSFESKTFDKMPDEMVREIIELYHLSSKEVEPKGGKMKLMFMPNSLITLTWRIMSGTSSKSIYEKISPIAHKIGENIFDEKITIYDDSLNDEFPNARSFDDEGVVCQPLTLVENGVLKSFYYDLDYGVKLNAKSTGHGYRTVTSFGAYEAITQPPSPALTHLRIKPGNKSFSQLVKTIDRGIILEGSMGTHSGNIPNGDYSVGVNPGLYVENGEIIGRVKDAMVAGNVYETLKHVIDVGDTLHPSFLGSWVPAILCDNVSVATKN